MRKLIIAGLLAAHINAQANDDINYNFIEIGYGYLDYTNNVAPDGFYLDGAFDLSDHFYLGGHLDNRADRGIDFNRYNASLGFHTNGSGKTDFYTDFRIGNLEFGNIDGTTMGLFAGTRTVFNDRFELVTKIGFTNLDDINHDDGNNLIIYEADVKGIFKFSNNQAMTAGLENYDGEFGAKIGYRYSF